MTITCYCDQCETDIIVDDGLEAFRASLMRFATLGTPIWEVANWLGWKLGQAFHGRFAQDKGVLTNYGSIRFYFDLDSSIESEGVMGLSQRIHGLCGGCFDYVCMPRTRQAFRPG